MDDELLISLVRSHPAFYDITDPGYSDYAYKQQAWRHIASELNVDVSVCKARWNNIRDNYRKSLKKNAARCAQAKKTKLYKYADQLSFIVEFFEERVDKSVSEMFAQEEFDSTLEGPVIEEEEEVEIKPEIGESVAEFNDSYPFESTHVAVPEVQLGKRIKLARESSCSKVPMAERRVECRFEEQDTGTSSNTQLSHPVDAFLAGIAPTLKTFPPYYLNLAKTEIFAAVQKYEMRMLEQQLAYGKPTSSFSDVTIMACPSTSRSDSTSSPKEIYED